MEWAYHLEEGHRDEHGHWQPRLVWADGMVTRSLGRVKGDSLAEAQRELASWNWRYCISAEDAATVIALARLRNATLAEESE